MFSLLSPSSAPPLRLTMLPPLKNKHLLFHRHQNHQHHLKNPLLPQLDIFFATAKNPSPQTSTPAATHSKKNPTLLLIMSNPSNSLREETNTVFIDKLHDDNTLGTLWNVFAPFSRVISVHRPQQRRMASNTRYAFVGFESKQQAANPIKEMNGTCVDGNRIVMQCVRPLSSTKPEWKVRSPPKSPVKPNDESQCPVLSRGQAEINGDLSDVADSGGHVKLFPSAVFIPTLEKSVVLRTMKKTSSEKIWEEMQDKGKVVHLVCKSPYEYLAFFQSVSYMWSFLERQKWNEEFWKVLAWCEDDSQQTRFANIAVSGIPPQASCEESVKTIVGKFGKIVEIESNMSEIPDYLVVFLVIQTSIFKIINEESSLIQRQLWWGVAEVWYDELGTKYQKFEVTQPVSVDGCPEEMTGALGSLVITTGGETRESRDTIIEKDQLSGAVVGNEDKIWPGVRTILSRRVLQT